jgi:hypothetical protein
MNISGSAQSLDTLPLKLKSLLHRAGDPIEHVYFPGGIAVGQVVQAGRTLTVCEGSVFDATRTRVLARMTATMMAVDATSS